MKRRHPGGIKAIKSYLPFIKIVVDIIKKFIFWNCLIKFVKIPKLLLNYEAIIDNTAIITNDVIIYRGYGISP